MGFWNLKNDDFDDLLRFDDFILFILFSPNLAIAPNDLASFLHVFFVSWKIQKIGLNVLENQLDFQFPFWLTTMVTHKETIPFIINLLLCNVLSTACFIKSNRYILHVSICQCFYCFRLIINHSLESGSQLPYIKKAKEVKNIKWTGFSIY